MKKTLKTLLVMLVAVFLLTTTATPAFAQNIDFDTIISEFDSTPFNDMTLEIGKTDTPTAALWVENGGSCYISDENVVSVDENGNVTAIGEGTAYVVIVPSSGGMYETYRYTVPASTSNNNVIGFTDKDGSKNNNDNTDYPTYNYGDIENTQDEMFSGVKKFFSMFAFVGAIPVIFIAIVFYAVISTIFKTSRLRQLIAEVESNPCQGTAEKLHKALKKLNPIHRLMFKMGGQGIIEKETWSVLYNYYIQPSKVISQETKEGIHKALIGIGVFKLKTSGNNGSAYDGQQRGDLGEDNVWHSLTALTRSEKCNIFHSVRVGTNGYTQEIDNVIVSPKGIFLIEVKSVTHKPANPYDNSDVVVFDDLNENPYQQIFEHQTAFVNAFGLDKSIIKNLLVMSYPHDEKKKIDISTFPTDTIYTALKVDDLLQYYMNYNSDVILDETTIASISQKLTKCINYKNDVQVTKYEFSKVTGAVNAASETTVKPIEQQAKFCPQCGNKLTTETPFCPNCGSKLN